MARIVRSFTVDRPAVDVFDAIADLSTAEEWDPGVRSARPSDGPRVGQGAGWRLESAVGPVGLPLEYTTTTWERPDHVVHRTESWFAVGVDDVRVAEERATTTVTWDASFTFRGPGRLVDALVQKRFEGIGDRAVRGLENWLRAGGRGHEPT